MTRSSSPFQQAAQRLTGKAKQVTGDVLGNERMAAEGALQQEKVDLEIEADRKATKAQMATAEAGLEQDRRETLQEQAELRDQIAGDRAEQQILTDERRAEQAAQAEAAAQARGAQAQAEAVEHEARAIDREADAERARAAVEAADVRAQAEVVRGQADAIEENNQRSQT